MLLIVAPPFPSLIQLPLDVLLELRKDLRVRVKAAWLRRRTHIVAAVDLIDLLGERGEALGYIGPNGAGKSTTLKMFTGVLYPSAGHVPAPPIPGEMTRCVTGEFMRAGCPDDAGGRR